VPNNGLSMLITPDAEKQLLRVAAFTSADFVTEKPLLTAGGGSESPAGYYNYLGTKIIVMNGLPGAGTSTAECLLYHRDAVGHACNSDDVQVEADYDKKQDSSWSRTTAYHGALLLQNSGVVRVRHDDTAA
jgi:Phage capsid protein